MTIADTWAVHCSTVTIDNLPVRVRQRTTTLLLDTIVCALVSADVPEGGRTVALAEASGMPIGSAPGTAYVLGRLAGLLDFEDSSPGGCHLGPSIVGSALSVGRSRSVSGAELISAIAVGFDLGVRTSSAMGSYLRTIDGTIVGYADIWGITAPSVMGAAGAAASAGRLSTEAAARALTLAGSCSPVPIGHLWNREMDLPSTKFGDSGWCAHVGSFAAIAATHEVSAPATVLDDLDGLLRIGGGNERDPSLMVRDLGRDWAVTSAILKQRPCCGSIDPAAHLLDRIVRDHGMLPADIDQITVEVGAEATSPRFLNPDPRTLASLQFSIPHIMAVVAAGIPAGSRWFDADVVENSEIAGLRARVEVTTASEGDAYPTTQGPARAPVTVSVRTRDGIVVSDSIHPARTPTRMTDPDDAVRTKAAEQLTATEADILLPLLDKVEKLDDITALLDMIVGCILERAETRSSSRP